MTTIIEVHEVAPQGQRRRVLWAPFLVLLPVLLAGGAIAAGPALALGTDTQLEVMSGTDAKSTEAALGQIEAASPDTAVAPKVVEAPHISVVPLYTPPPPVSRSGGKARVTAAVGMSYTAFCAGGNAAYYPGSSLSGWVSTINQERARIGVRPLTWSSSLASKAQGWSNTMVSTDASNGGSVGDALSHNPKGGYENVAMNYNSSDKSMSRALKTAHGGLMRSEGHCKNLMNPKLTKIGIGAAETPEHVWYVTQNFS